MYGGLIGTHQSSFEWYHPDPYGLPFLEIGGTGVALFLSQEQVKLRTSNLAGTFTEPIRIKAY